MGMLYGKEFRILLDKEFKRTGHSNAYFPLFVPKSYLSKEADHIDGFAKECAVVTHHRLMIKDGSIIVDPTSKLEEELIVRPTSETVVWQSYKKWIRSHRDLPLLLNQWANVVRWEMRPRLFLRTTEFLWQEGHTAHASKAEAIEETKKMLEVYASFIEKMMGIPVIRGIKTPLERFAGAVDTYCLESLMQDGKALQVATSHFLGQNFSKAFDVKFTSKEGILDYVWGTSWGVSTRLMGALIMTHSDDKGLILPPYLAPIQVVIIPIFNNQEELALVSEKVINIQQQLKEQNIRSHYDNDTTKRPGFKYAKWELKGVPIRITIGPRDLKSNTLEVVRRDIGEKKNIHYREDAGYYI